MGFSVLGLLFYTKFRTCLTIVYLFSTDLINIIFTLIEDCIQPFLK